MNISEKTIKQETAVSQTRQIDWPIIIFFALAYLIAWSMIPVLSAIARQSGVADWTTLSQMAEVLEFGGIDLSVPGWVVYLITRLQARLLIHKIAVDRDNGAAGGLGQVGVIGLEGL